MSLSTASMPPCRTTSSAFEPVGTEVTRKPFSFRPASSIRRMERSSSATKMCEDMPGKAFSIMIHFSERNPKLEYGTGTHHTTNRNRSAVQFGDLPHKGQAKARTGNIHVFNSGNAIELFENAIHTAFWYSVPLI